MPEKDDQRFQSSNKCWICDELFHVGDNTVRDHFHITRKYKTSVHWSCNIILGLTFFKLMNNSTFDETMENLRKGIKVRLFNNAGGYKKYVSKPSFVSQKIFNKNVVAIHEIKPVLSLDKPIYVGFSILDLSKSLMYEFHYKCIKRKYNAKLLFTDTDSLVYEIKTNDVLKIL